MKTIPIIGVSFCLFTSVTWGDALLTAPSELSQGIQAYQEERLMTALGHFIHVISQDPTNKEARTYVYLISEKLQARKIQESHEKAIAILEASSRLLQSRGQDSHVIDESLRSVLAKDAEREAAERHAHCTMAQMEAQLGHLEAANDLVLSAIAQDPNDQEAQQLLSTLQSQIRQTLDSSQDLPEPERRTLEGFYAYGQADYASAAAAWGQVRSALDKSWPPEQATHQVALLHFEAYEKVAQAHLEEERQAAKARSLFSDGLAAFENHDFDKSLESFRQVALLNPEYSQLGTYLVQSEAAVERKRTGLLTDANRQKIAQSFAKGLAGLEKGRYADAKASFQEVLALDPAHPQAKLYIRQIESQKQSSTDPEAGKQHYEAGVVAFVAGDMEQAIREWHIALRFDPENPKVVSAMSKIQRVVVSAKPK